MIWKYKNGNVYVTINDSDGTKTRFTKDDEFMPDFAESMDVHISDCCDNGCEYCYAGCSINGKHGRFDYKFLDTVHPHTEMAINLQIPCPDGLLEFLEKMKEKDVIVNATVNQNHFMDETFRTALRFLQGAKLIHGIGISLVEVTDRFLKAVQGLDNVVIHCINGIVTTGDLYKLSQIPHVKILILGYKKIGRGKSYIADKETAIKVRNRKGFLYWNIKFILEEKWFDVIAFDNLALEQLNVKRFLTNEEWKRCYQGEDGSSTFFINLVDGTFGINSLTTKEERRQIGDKSIDEMFEEVQKWKSA